MRTFIVGYECSLADIAVFGVLRGNAFMRSVLKYEVYVNISRWYSFLNSNREVKEIMEKINKSFTDLRKKSKSSDNCKKESHMANFEINLPNAKIGQVVTRFPPEPSGYLHIGHVKAAILNEYFAHVYKGNLILRFDDTNPTKEKVEFQDSIIEDLALMGNNADKITYSSDYFEQMYELAVKMIKLGKAYCDDTPSENIREERMVGEKSTRRERSIEENLKIFTEEMKTGFKEGLKNCFRAKIDFKTLNKTIRDPALYNSSPQNRYAMEDVPNV